MHFQIKTMSHGKYSNRHFYTGHKIEKKIKRNARHLHLNQVSNSIVIHCSSILAFTIQNTYINVLTNRNVL